MFIFINNIMLVTNYLHRIRDLLGVNNLFLQKKKNQFLSIYPCVLPSVSLRVLTRILKIGVKCCPPEKVGVLPYLFFVTFQKVGVRNEKLE